MCIEEEQRQKYEKEHEERYLKLLANVEGGLVFSREGDMIWQCSNCGHVVVGKQAPELCPVCAHPQAYFEIKAENYQPLAIGHWPLAISFAPDIEVGRIFYVIVKVQRKITNLVNFLTLPKFSVLRPPANGQWLMANS